MVLSLGSLVVNFSTTARVVGFFAAVDGRPCAEAGWPILRQVGASGRLRGGRWVADPAQCSPVAEAGAVFAHASALVTIGGGR